MFLEVWSSAFEDKCTSVDCISGEAERTVDDRNPA